MKDVEHPPDVVLGFWERGDAGMAVYGLGSRIVGCKRQPDIAELRKHHGEVARRPVKVFMPVMRVDTEKSGRARHELAKADGPGRGPCLRIVAAFYLDIGAIDRQPIRDAETCLAQARVVCITLPDIGDGGENPWIRRRERAAPDRDRRNSGLHVILARDCPGAAHDILADPLMIGAGDMFLGD